MSLGWVREGVALEALWNGTWYGAVVKQLRPQCCNADTGVCAK